MHLQSNQFVRCSAAWSSVWEQGGMHILGGVYIRKEHLVFKSLPYQILALWHQLRDAFYLSAYKMTSFITLLYLVIFWWLLFEIKKKKRARERLCICPIPQPRIAAGCKTIYKPKSSFYKLTVQSFAAPQLYCWYRRMFAVSCTWPEVRELAKDLYSDICVYILLIAWCMYNIWLYYSDSNTLISNSLFFMIGVLIIKE